MNISPNHKDRIYTILFIVGFTFILLGLLYFTEFIIELSVIGIAITILQSFISPRVNLTMFIKQSKVKLDEMDIALVTNDFGKVKYQLGIYSDGKKVYKWNFNNLADAEYYKKEMEPELKFT
tara:strand:+ start:3061 stop:3426 length:366 start_codon:yes stop_codon:yes gene_type:complete